VTAGQEIKFFEDADGAGVILRGAALDFFTESAARQDVTVDRLLSGIVCKALARGEF